MSENEKITAPEASSVLQATYDDFVALVRVNPSLELPLTNIVQQRMLAEKDAEIALLRQTAGVNPHAEEDPEE